jgi:unsaturated chondroitin disaccharide hydrolase
MRIDTCLRPGDLVPGIERFWELSGLKLRSIHTAFDRSSGAPVCTVEGVYTTRAWTDWTQGFEYGSQLLQYDAGGDEAFLAMGAENTFTRMTEYLTHAGVHDHGFNVVSTFGTMLRLIREGKAADYSARVRECEMALRCSGATQARRWTAFPEGGGYVYSFNGPHSLFADTIRSMRSLALAWQLGHGLMGENDRRISLLDRLLDHAETTARWSVYYGEERDAWDCPGRVAQESIFNIHDGCYRCPNSQQGYSPFTTWTRGLAWIMCGYAELLEFIDAVPDEDCATRGGKTRIRELMERAAGAVCDFYISNTPRDGIPYWDTGAPGLSKMGAFLDRPSEPFNAYEPVDSSAAAIACQGLMRFGSWLNSRGDSRGNTYVQAGLTVCKTLLEEPYLSTGRGHQGLILHSVYHRPNGWDHIPRGRNIPCGESSMWGDYHAREAMAYVQRLAGQGPYLAFYLQNHGDR